MKALYCERRWHWKRLRPWWWKPGSHIINFSVYGLTIKLAIFMCNMSVSNWNTLGFEVVTTFHSNWGPITNIELIESFLVKVILCQWYVSCADTSYIKWDLWNSYFVTGPWIPPSFNYSQNFPSSYLGWFICRILHSLGCLYRSEN